MIWPLHTGKREKEKLGQRANWVQSHLCLAKLSDGLICKSYLWNHGMHPHLRCFQGFPSPQRRRVQIILGQTYCHFQGGPSSGAHISHESTLSSLALWSCASLLTSLNSMYWHLQQGKLSSPCKVFLRVVKPVRVKRLVPSTQMFVKCMFPWTE